MRHPPTHTPHRALHLARLAAAGSGEAGTLTRACMPPLFLLPQHRHHQHSVHCWRGVHRSWCECVHVCMCAWRRDVSNVDCSAREGLVAAEAEEEAKIRRRITRVFSHAAAHLLLPLPPCCPAGPATPPAPWRPSRRRWPRWSSRTSCATGSSPSLWGVCPSSPSCRWVERLRRAAAAALMLHRYRLAAAGPSLAAAL